MSESVAVGESIEQLIKSQANGRMKNGKPCGNLPQGKSRDLTAAVVNMSGKTYEKAKAVVAAAAPELRDAVDSNEVSIDAAAALVSLPKSEQKTVVAQGGKAVIDAAKKIKAEQAN